MNLVEMILKALGGDTLGKLAGLLGADKDETQGALGAAVPALLGGIGAMASKPEGAEKLWSAIEGMDDNVADDFSNMLGGDNSNVLESMGGDLLEGLFGKGLMGTLVTVLSSFLGGKSNMISKLLPLLAPVIMGVLSKQVKSGGLDLGGLVKLILGQQGNIASAMPAGLGSALSAAPGMGDLANFAAAPAAAPAPAAAAEKSSSPMGWLIPLIAVLAIGGYMWSIRKGGDVNEDNAGEVGSSIEDTAIDLGNAATDAAGQVGEVTTNFKDLFANMGDVLGNVEDAASAQEALPKLKEMGTKVDALSTSFGNLPEAARTGIVPMIKEALAKLEEKKETLLAIPGVGDILRPIIDPLFEKLTALLPE